jgi:SAM-dependent methyltransferase
VSDAGLVYSAVNLAVLHQIPSTVKSVLDIGCGDGALGAALKRRARCAVTGVTASEEESRRARAVLDDVVHADVETASLASLGTFDVVVCSHILEHLRDPRRVLNGLRSNLTQNDILVVALPNPLVWQQRLAFLRGQFRYTEGGIMDSTHLKFFDWVTARELVRTAGYQILDAVAEGGFPGSRHLPASMGQVARGLDRAALKGSPGLFGVQFIIAARPLVAGEATVG